MSQKQATSFHAFHAFNSPPVVGLREGSWLDVKDDSIVLKGTLQARIFEYNKQPYEVGSGTELNHLK